MGVNSGFAYFVILFLFLALAWLAARSLRLASLRAQVNERIALDTREGMALAQTVSLLTGDRVNSAELGAFAAVTAAEFVWN